MNSFFQNTVIPTDIHTLIASRRSHFQFQDRQVSDDILLRALDAAIWAPNHKLTQPWRFVIAGPQMQLALSDFFHQRLRQKMLAFGFSDEDIALHLQESYVHPPCQILAYLMRHENEKRFEEDYAAVCCAIMNLCLSAWADGVASGWKSFDHADAYQLFELDPQKTKIVGLIQLGYPLRHVH